jgi:hypothetical protein
LPRNSNTSNNNNNRYADINYLKYKNHDIQKYLKIKTTKTIWGRRSRAIYKKTTKDRVAKQNNLYSIAYI